MTEEENNTSCTQETEALYESLLSLNLRRRVKEVDLDTAIKMARLVVLLWYYENKNNGPTYSQTETRLFMRTGVAVVHLMQARSGADFKRRWDKYWEWK